MYSYPNTGIEEQKEKKLGCPVYKWWMVDRANLGTKISHKVERLVFYSMRRSRVEKNVNLSPNAKSCTIARIKTRSPLSLYNTS